MPFQAHADVLTLRKYNWGHLTGAADGLDPVVLTIARPALIIVEGCQVLSRETVECFDLRIWVDTPAAEALRRGMQRDVEEYGLDPVTIRQQWTAWARREQRMLAQDDRRLRADVIHYS